MEKKRVNVQIEGKNYVIVTTEDEEYVRGVAAEVIQALRKSAQASIRLNERDCAILAALDFCDDRNKAIKRNKNLIAQTDPIIRRASENAKQCKEYKERLAEAMNENTRLTKRVRALEEQLRILNNENEALKKKSESKNASENEKKFEESLRKRKSEKLMGVVPMRQVTLFELNGQNNA